MNHVKQEFERALQSDALAQLRARLAAGTRTLTLAGATGERPVSDAILVFPRP